MDVVLWIVLALAVLNLVVMLFLGLRPRGGDGANEGLERLERELRDEVSRSGQSTRQELSGNLSNFQRTLLAQQSDVARTQNEQIDTFRTQLGALQQAVSSALQNVVASLAAQSLAAREAQDAALKRLSDVLNEQLRSVGETVEKRLGSLQQGNEQKLEQMRATVDEKLHATLEARLGESFKQVADRLDQVHRGLGEMQGLAKDVGSLNRVLSNVKVRGTFGEMQLAGLLEQVFTPEQYATNVETVPGSGARVEFALRFPGRRDNGEPVWLPIDAKFPREDYERLLDAQERADVPAAEAAGRALELRLRLEAKTIHEKYVAPPHTTDFAILFVPTESLYAEALRRPGLFEAMQREHRVMLAGPTTLLATLNSLQMGFRSLALEQRSAEVWEVLGAVKTEFTKFGTVLARVKDQTTTVLKSIDAAEVRTRQMTRALRSVEGVGESRAQALLPGAEPDIAADVAGDLAGDESV